MICSTYFDNPEAPFFDMTMSYLRFCVYDEDISVLEKRMKKLDKNEKTRAAFRGKNPA